MKHITAFLMGSMVLAAALVSNAAHADVEIEDGPRPAPSSPSSPSLPQLPPRDVAPQAALPQTVPEEAAPQVVVELAPTPDPSIRPEPARRGPALGWGCADRPEGCGAEGSATATAPRWYGYQTMMVDVSAVLLGFSSVATGAAGGVAAAGTYVVGTPIVHLAHGNYAAFGISLGMRTGGPLLGGLVGFGAGMGVGGCDSSNGYCAVPFAGALVGAVGGMLAAVVVDAAVFAKEPREPRTTAKSWDGKPTLAPAILPSPQGGSVGVSGSF